MTILDFEKSMSTSDPTPLFFSKLTPKLLQLPSFLRTLYLFTAADFPTFAIPTTLFAVFASLSGSPITTSSTPSLLPALLRLPLALLSTWSNLLIFDISNQRHPSAVAEDRINKPNRPLPQGLISTEESRRLLLIGIPLVMALNWYLGAAQETLLLLAFTWMYNDLQGCDENIFSRNALIAIGYGLYSSAALRVMGGRGVEIAPAGFQWVGLVTLVMFVTQHICDIKDVEGDRSRGRMSIPIVMGEEWARWSVALPIMGCSVLCPAFFGLGVWSYISTCCVGALVAGRTLAYRDLKSDRLTWKLWAFWTVWLFALPLAKEPGCLVAAYEGLRNMFCPGDYCRTSLNLVAVSSVALLVESKRLYGEYVGSGVATNATTFAVVERL